MCYKKWESKLFSSKIVLRISKATDWETQHISQIKPDHFKKVTVECLGWRNHGIYFTCSNTSKNQLEKSWLVEGNREHLALTHSHFLCLTGLHLQWSLD